MGKFIDLHTHSDYSDGTDRPGRILSKAVRAGLSAIAITDHDSIAGQQEAIEIAEGLGIEYITGIEFSTKHNRTKYHILGYFIEPGNQQLIATEKSLLEQRMERGRKMLEKLANIRKPLEFDDVLTFFTGNCLTRLHIAKAMVKRGYVRNVQEAFDKYIAKGKPAYVPRKGLYTKEAIKLIHQAGGIAVWAHPFIMGKLSHLPDLLSWGLDGIEVYYPKHSPENVKILEKYADKYGLVKTGGSDYHGKGTDMEEIGKFKVPYSLLEAMKERLRYTQRR